MSRRALSLLMAASALLPTGLGCGPTTPPPATRPPEGPAPLRLPPEQRKAAELAQAYLEKNGTKWGQPVKVERLAPGEGAPAGGDTDTYRVTYPTPPKEVPVLSHRTVLVNLKTGKVTVPPRD